MSKKQLLSYFAVGFPILGLLLWLSTLQRVVVMGDSVTLEVQGYDPRDLLAGHYIQFSLKLPSTVCTGNDLKDKNYCICFDYASPAQVSWSGLCDARNPAECTRWISGTCNWNRFQSTLSRYYIPEGTPEMEIVPSSGALITASLDGSGGGIVTSFTPLPDTTATPPQQ